MTIPLQLTRPPDDPETPVSELMHVPTPELKAVQSFFSLEGLEAGLSAGGVSFTQIDLVRTLVRLSQDPDPKVQLQAITKLTAYIETCLRLNGRIAHVTQKEKRNEPSGTSVTRTASVTAAFNSLPVPAAPVDTELPKGATTVFDART